jgi:hypothetical protein
MAGQGSPQVTPRKPRRREPCGFAVWGVVVIIVETIGPWKSIAGSSGTRNVRAGGPAANIEQRHAAVKKD